MILHNPNPAGKKTVNPFGVDGVRPFERKSSIFSFLALLEKPLSREYNRGQWDFHRTGGRVNSMFDGGKI